MDKRDIIVAVTGASGSVYAKLFCMELAAREDIGEIALIFTENGRKVSEYEGCGGWWSSPRFKVYANDDLFSAPASGSAGYGSMVIIPCSMGMAGRIANGISDDLVSRAADVMLKERRRLIIVPRETPFNTIHLRNLTSLSECGAVVCPASPSFYSRPDGIESLCRTVTQRVIQLLGFDSERYRWKGGE